MTFWHGRTLRGCVGRFVETSDLASTVASVTVSSLADRRFAVDPVARGELDSLRIELSVLSHLVACSDPLSLRVGVDGVVIRRGGISGCFLPQVGLDQGWSALELLRRCCTMKAGLPADGWRATGTEVFTFTAQVFSEKRR